MKKLMIAAVVFCVAIAAQAATIGWNYNVAWLAETDQDNYLPCTVYVFAGDSTAAAAKATALATLGVSALEGNLGYGSNTEEGFYVESTDDTRLTLTPAEPGAKWDTASMYSILVDSTGTKFALGYADTIEATDVYLTADNVEFYADEFYPGSVASWTDIGGGADTPEPTSGLLLLIGVAGLALRRKQK